MNTMMFIRTILTLSLLGSALAILVAQQQRVDLNNAHSRCVLLANR